MTPEKQRIAIAEACGWKEVRLSTLRDHRFKTYHPVFVGRPSGSISNTEAVPDYLNSLDAMREVESKALRDGHSYWRFIELLDGLVKHDEHVDYVADRASATPAQHAKAFLHALNLWVEE